jgi:hypothetical protein
MKEAGELEEVSLASRPQKLICDYAEDFLRAES